jgi:hypothetical protein
VVFLNLINGRLVASLIRCIYRVKNVAALDMKRDQKSLRLKALQSIKADHSALMAALIIALTALSL